MSRARAILEAEDPKDFLRRVSKQGRWLVKPIEQTLYMVTLWFSGEEVHNISVDTGHPLQYNYHHNTPLTCERLTNYLNWVQTRLPWSDRESWVPESWLSRADRRGLPELYMKETAQPAFKRAGKTGVTMVFPQNTPGWLEMGEAEDPKTFFKRLMWRPTGKRAYKIVYTDDLGEQHAILVERCVDDTQAANLVKAHVMRVGYINAIVDVTHQPLLAATCEWTLESEDPKEFLLRRVNDSPGRPSALPEAEDPKRFLQQHGRDFKYSHKLGDTLFRVVPLNRRAIDFCKSTSIPSRWSTTEEMTVPGRYAQQFLAQAGDQGITGFEIKESVVEETKLVIESVADDIAKEASKAEKPKSPEEAEAGTYKKGHIWLHGMDISIENAKGSTRSGEDKDGKKWSIVLPAHYGYIKGTVGKDKDHIDVYIGEHPTNLLVFVVNQHKKEGGFDEHKCLIGFTSKDEAIAAYDAAFMGDLGPKLRHSVVSATVDQFKHWLEKGNPKKEYANLEEDKDPHKPRLATQSALRWLRTPATAPVHDVDWIESQIEPMRQQELTVQTDDLRGAVPLLRGKRWSETKSKAEALIEAEDPKAFFRQMPRSEWSYHVSQ